MSDAETFLLSQQIQRVRQILSVAKKHGRSNIPHFTAGSTSENDESSVSDLSQGRVTPAERYALLEQAEEGLLTIDRQIGLLMNQEKVYRKNISIISKSIIQQEQQLRKLDSDWSAEMAQLTKSLDVQLPESDIKGIIISYCTTQRLPESLLISLIDPKTEKDFLDCLQKMKKEVLQDSIQLEAGYYKLHQVIALEKKRSVEKVSEGDIVQCKEPLPQKRKEEFHDTTPLNRSAHRY